MTKFGKWVVERKREFWILLLLVIGIEAIILFRNGNNTQENRLVYSSFNDAVHAGVDEQSLGLPLSGRQDANIYIPLCSYPHNGAEYCVMWLPLEEEGNLTYSDNVYVMKIVSTEKGYTYELLSALYAIYMEDESGADIMGEGSVVTLSDKTNDYMIQVGKARSHMIISPDSSDLICTNLKDGIPENTSNIFVLVYSWDDTLPPAPEMI